MVHTPPDSNTEKTGRTETDWANNIKESIVLGGSGYDLGCINKGASFHDVGGRIETLVSRRAGGFMLYRLMSQSFGTEYRDNIFVCLSDVYLLLPSIALPHSSQSVMNKNPFKVKERSFLSYYPYSWIGLSPRFSMALQRLLWSSRVSLHSS